MGSCKTLGLIGVVWITALGNVRADEENWTPTQEQVAQLEHELTLPPEARHPLSEYVRYYWGITDKGHRSIRGVLAYGQTRFVETNGSAILFQRVYPGLHLRNKPVLATRTDQGCNWIYVAYGQRMKKPDVACDGRG